jgi:hypothetical protein
LKRELVPHGTYIFALAIDSKGRLYTGSCDGTLHVYERPLISSVAKKLLQCRLRTTELLSLYIDEDDTLYAGDNHGIITKWEREKMVGEIEVAEEVNGLAAEGGWIYSVRNQDLQVTEMTGHKGIYTTRAVIPGHAPVILCGPTVENKKSYIVMLTRDCKSMKAVSNNSHFDVLWTKKVNSRKYVT